MTFCHNDFFFCQPVSCEILHAVSKKLSPVSCAVSKNCHQFHAVSKNCHQFQVQFQKKLSLFSVVVVKLSVFLQKKKHDYKVWFWQLAKKLFFELQNVETLTDFFFWQIFWNFTFFFSNFFSIWQFWIDFLCIIFFRFFQIYTTTADFIKLKWNWEQFHWKYLKLFEIICKCHSFTETGCKKKSRYWHKIG